MKNIPKDYWDCDKRQTCSQFLRWKINTKQDDHISQNMYVLLYGGGDTHTHTHQWLCRGFKIFPKFFYNQTDFLIKTDFLKAWRHYNKQTQLPICMTIKVFKKYISPYLKYFLITLKTQACNNKILKRNELNERICFPLKNKQTCPVKIMVLTILYTYVIAPIAAC